MLCPHSISDMDVACADGMCPLCLVETVQILNATIASQLETIEQLRARDAKWRAAAKIYIADQSGAELHAMVTGND